MIWDRILKKMKVQSHMHSFLMLVFYMNMWWYNTNVSIQIPLFLTKTFSNQPQYQQNNFAFVVLIQNTHSSSQTLVQLL